MNCIVFSGFGVSGDWLPLGAPSTHKMFHLSVAMYVHGVRVRVQFSTHYGTIISWDMEFWLHVLIEYSIVYICLVEIFVLCCGAC